MDHRGFFSTRRWLGRLSFSFFILAFWLLYTAYNGLKNHSLEQWRAMLIFVGALFSFVLGLMGVRERHAIEANDEEDSNSQTRDPK